MLHIIAFIVIGVVVGYFIAQNSKKAMVPIIILALIGSFLPGYLTISVSKYGSLGLAIVGAVVLGYIGKAVFGKK